MVTSYYFDTLPIHPQPMHLEVFIKLHNSDSPSERASIFERPIDHTFSETSSYSRWRIFCGSSFRIIRRVTGGSSMFSC